MKPSHSRTLSHSYCSRKHRRNKQDISTVCSMLQVSVGKSSTSGELHRSKARGTDTRSGPGYNSLRTHRSKLESPYSPTARPENPTAALVRSYNLVRPTQHRPSAPSPPHIPHFARTASRPVTLPWLVYTAIGCLRLVGSFHYSHNPNINWLIQNSAQKSHISIQLWSQWRNGSALDFYRIHQATVIQRLRVRAPPEMLFAFCIFLPFFCACTG
jgi:hypothetical protein